MKIRANDCLYILRSFGIATGKNIPRDITRLKVTNPQPNNTLAEFKFENATYVLLFDDAAEDDAEYVVEQVAIPLPGRDVSLIENNRSNVHAYALPYEGKSVYLLKVDADKLRLDSHLASTRPELSRSSWQKYIKAGRVSVDGKVKKSPKFALGKDSSVAVDLPDAPTHDKLELPIIYIDDDVIVVDKPVGVLTHSKNQLDHEFTVADFFRRYTTHGLDTDRPGIVHRLDRDTSGLVIGARHPRAYQHLKAQFADRLVSKTYIAVVQGTPDHELTHIDLPIARNLSRPGSFTVKRDGKSAQTDVRLLRSDGEHSLLELSPRTGRTHQLRVHLANLNLPILGDRLYGKPADRLYLHAAKLELELPSGESADFVSELPAEFNQRVGGD